MIIKYIFCPLQCWINRAADDVLAPNTYISLVVYVQLCNICCRSSLFSCASERLVCWRYIVLCFMSAIWQHLYWKAQNCWAHVYTVPLPPPPHTFAHSYSFADQTGCCLCVYWQRVWIVNMIMSVHFPQMSDLIIKHVAWTYRQSSRSAVLSWRARFCRGKHK